MATYYDGFVLCLWILVVGKKQEECVSPSAHVVYRGNCEPLWETGSWTQWAFWLDQARLFFYWAHTRDIKKSKGQPWGGM